MKKEQLRIAAAVFAVIIVSAWPVFDNQIGSQPLAMSIATVDGTPVTGETGTGRIDNRRHGGPGTARPVHGSEADGTADNSPGATAPADNFSASSSAGAPSATNAPTDVALAPAGDVAPGAIGPNSGASLPTPPAATAPGAGYRSF